MISKDIQPSSLGYPSLQLLGKLGGFAITCPSFNRNYIKHTAYQRTFNTTVLYKAHGHLKVLYPNMYLLGGLKSMILTTGLGSLGAVIQVDRRRYTIPLIGMKINIAIKS